MMYININNYSNKHTNMYTATSDFNIIAVPHIYYIINPQSGVVTRCCSASIQLNNSLECMT